LIELNLKVHFLTWFQGHEFEPILAKFVIC